MEFDQTDTMRSMIKGETTLLAIGYAIWLPVLLMIELAFGLWSNAPFVAIAFLAISLVMMLIMYVALVYVPPWRVVIDDIAISGYFRYKSTPLIEKWSDMQRVIAFKRERSRLQKFPIYPIRFHKKTLWRKYSGMLLDEHAYRELERRLIGLGIPLTKGKGFS